MAVTGTIAGQSIAGYVRSCRRRAHLCNPGQTVTITIDPSFPIIPKPSDAITLLEEGVLVLTGYVQKATRSKPSFDWIVEGMDTYQRAQSFFIEDNTIIGHDPVTDQPVKGYVPQTTDYWLGYLLSLCGATYTIESGGHTVPQGVQLGLRSVHESMQDILAYSSQYVWARPDGTIEVKRASRNAADYTLTDFTHFEYKKDDEWTRDVIKVFGTSTGYGSRQQSIFATASVSLANIIPDRISAIATPMIQTQAEAQRVANYMLSELGEVTWVATGTIEGNPNIHIGDSARMAYEDFDRTDVITSLDTDWDENGYLMQVTIGERCPRISGWSKLSPPVFAGTTQHGVYKSLDGGINWAEFNTGLPVGNKNITRMGFNSFYEGMAIVNGALYYTDGLSDTWSPRYLPPPVNDAGDSPPLGYGRMISVDAMGGIGEFAVLTSNGLATSGSSPSQMRAWIYTCESSGSTPSLWASTQMTTGSGYINPYNLRGWDLTASSGAPVAVLSSGSLWVATPQEQAWHVEKMTDDRNAYDYFDHPSFSWRCSNNYTLAWHVKSMVNTATDTIITIDIDAQYFGRGSYVYLYGTYGDRGGFALTDDEGFRYWEFTSDAYLVSPGVWRTILTLNREGMPLATPGWDIAYFNIFCYAKGTIPPSAMLTHGDSCGDEHVIGSSPYADRYHPGWPSSSYPMPFQSTICAGMIYWA